MTRFTHQTQTGSGGPLRRDNASSSPVRMDASTSGIPAASGSAEVPASEQLRFTVRYALPEYISFMWQHAGYLIRRRRIGRLATWWMLSKSTSAAALHFVAQGRSRHLYDFTLDAHGIIRASGTGVTLVPWSDVSAIRRYSCGYMLVLKRGTLPIPFRCLDGAQLGAMDAFATMLKAMSRH
ncbi:MAG: YcxB family protein [Pseudomonadota bacterium]